MNENLKKILWKMHGTSEFPSEWDGNIHGGGKGGQRFWEYLWTIDKMDITESSVILDVGAGNSLFFPKLLKQVCGNVWAIDPEIDSNVTAQKILQITLDDFIYKFENNLNSFEIITCVSVLEHMSEEEKVQFCRQLDKFKKASIILTFEFGMLPISFNYQLSVFSLYSCFKEFKNHYISEMSACPVWCENSGNGVWRPVGVVLYPI